MPAQVEIRFNSWIVSLTSATISGTDILPLVDDDGATKKITIDGLTDYFADRFAASGVNSDITSFDALNIRTITSSDSATDGDFIILVNSAAGSFPFTVPRELGASGKKKVLFIIKVGTDRNAVTVQDDQGTPAEIAFLGSSGQHAIVAVVASTVYGASA